MEKKRFTVKPFTFRDIMNLCYVTLIFSMVCMVLLAIYPRDNNASLIIVAFALIGVNSVLLMMTIQKMERS